MLFAETAVLIHFEPFRIILFILHGVIISLLAFAARQCDFGPHLYAPFTDLLNEKKAPCFRE